MDPILKKIVKNMDKRSVDDIKQAWEARDQEKSDEDNLITLSQKFQLPLDMISDAICESVIGS